MKTKYIDLNKITDIVKGGHRAESMYKGAELLWRKSIRSCFSNGYWINEYPWTEDLGWKN